MKKKQIAVLLAALLSVSTAVEGTAVMGAEFSSGEETVETMDPASAEEEVVPEIAETENEEAAEGIWVSEE